jgi:hypothetical protein
MGEWSDYFEDFPDQNPANYVNGRFDPRAAEEQRRRELNTAQVRAESAELQRKMLAMAAAAKAEAAARRAAAEALKPQVPPSEA